MKVAVRLLIVGLTILAALFLLDVATVKWWLPLPIVQWMGCLLTALMTVAFFLTFRHADGAKRLCRTLLLTLIATAVWGFIVLVSLVNFHLAIGGHL